MINTLYPLSKPQYQIWLANESCPDKALYTEAVLLIFDNALSPAKLNDALRQLVQHTETLRIRLVRTADGPMQYDAGYAPFACRVLPAADETELHKAFDAQAYLPFDIYNSPLFEAVIYTLPDKTAVALRIHHLIADGYGFTSVYGRFLALCAGKTPKPFTSFLSRVKAAANAPQNDADGAFWQSYLEGFEPGALPHPMPADVGHKIMWSSHSVGFRTSIHVRSFAKRHAVTPFCVFFAAYALYLSRLLGTEDICVIVPRLGRTKEDMEAAGMYTMAVPVRVQVKPEFSFPELCQHIQAQNRAAAAHKAYGLSELMDDLSREGRGGTLSYFTLSYQDFALERHGLPVRYAMHFGGAMTNLLTLHVVDWTGGHDSYQFQMDYRADYYTAQDINSMVDIILCMLDFLMLHHDMPIGQLQSLPEHEQKRMCQLLAGPVLPFPEDSTIVSMFRAQAAKTPDAHALSGKGRSYTFAELDAASDIAARNLAAAGVTPESLVAFLLPRTTDLPVILLGILKAGAAYVPVDPAYPLERIRYILSDSHAALLISDTVVSDITCLPPAAVLAENPQNAALALPQVQPDWLCYIIYTSGTTGRPKGVMVEHRGIANFMQPGNNEFNRDIAANGKGIVAVGSICFDISAFELFATLLNGIPVTLADEDSMNNPESLAKSLSESGANILHCTPSRLLAYLDEPAFREAMRGVDIVLAAGETFTQPLLNALTAATSARLYNGYGPTEVTIGVTIGRITDRITIGSTIAGARVYLLDSRHQLVPPGATGEIAVGGNGVTRGYLGRPELTAERFITLSNGIIKDRVYLTGDHGYALPDGQLVYCGRRDDQVKLRGLRIELGEIERCMESYAGIRQCAAIVKEIDGREHLCCYYSADSAQDENALKQYAGGFLTHYMVPELFLYLPELPQTVNGKIDKRLLMERAIHVERTYVPPRTARERTMCHIFAQTLKLKDEDVSVTDSFFALGGTSLQAAHIVLLAKHEGFNLEYGQIFEHPTVRALVQDIDQDYADTPLEPAAPENALCTAQQAAVLRDVLYHNHNYQRGLRPLGNVLLTGATGFLGIHILYELLSTTYGKIYCMVRGKNNLTPEKRLKGSLFYYFEDNFASAFGTRLFAIDGNLMNEEIVQLPEGVRIDTVINCAADVSHFGVGNRIRQTNVDGVRNVIAFCKKHDAALVQISTLSVGGFIEQDMADIGVSLSEQRLWIRQDLSNAYLESKFLAEKMILLEIPNGLRAKIMRVGNLQGRISDGEFQMNRATNGFTKLLQSIVSTGRCPMSMARSWMNFSPVDAVSRAICRMAGSAEPYTVFHIFDSNDLPVSRLLARLEEIGYPVQAVDDAAFDEFMLHAAEDPTFSGTLDGFLTRVTGGRHMAETPCESGFSIRALEQEGFSWPEITDAYLTAYLTGLDTLGAFQSKDGV